MIARSLLRRSWPSLLTLALLVAVSGSVVLSTAAGARRTATAFDRFLEHVAASDVALGQDSQLRPEVLRRLAALPGIEATGSVAFLVMAPEGVAQLDANAVAPADDRWSVELDRPFIVAGRMPEAVDEVAVNEAFAERLDVRVGDRVPFRSFGRAQLADLFSGEAREPLGPRVTPRLVGILRHPRDLALDSSAQLEAFFANAFFERYREEILSFGPSMMLRLEDGAAGISAFERAVAETQATLTGSAQEDIGPFAQDEDIRVTDNHELYRPVRDAARIQAIAVGLVSLLVLVASVIAIGLALARHAANAGVEAPRLAALGMRRRELVLAAVLPGIGAIASGVVVSSAVAVVVSGAFPFGALRRVEPQPGISIDAAAVLTAAALYAASLTAVVVIGAYRALRGVVTTEGPLRGSASVRFLASVGGSPAALVGIRFAREPGSGRTGVPIRSVTFGAAAGVLALAGAVTVAANLGRFVEQPAQYGWNWDLAVTGGDDPATMTRTVERLRDIDGVDGIAAVLLADVEVRGEVLQAAFVESVDGDVFPTIIEGRRPSAADEIALGTATLRRFGASIGDRLDVGGTRTATFEIVGRTVLPVFDEGRLDEGAVLAASARDRIEPIPDFPIFPVRISGDGTAVRALLADEFGETNVAGVTRPGDVENLARISGVPWMLAAVLAALALATIAHAIVLTTRRRARDLAILKTLGFVRRQVRSAVAWQAFAFMLAACLLGIPAGTVAGRWAWITMAERIGVAAAPAVPALLLLLGIPIGLAASAMFAAALPGRSAARTEPAVVLRAG